MRLLRDGPLSEHCGYPYGLPVVNVDGTKNWQAIFFRGDLSSECPCIRFSKGEDEKWHVHTSYYIGTDWVEEGELAVYVEPKLNNSALQTDYFKMLFAALSNPDIGDELPKLFEMKADKPFIVLRAQQDLLTPLLVLQFLQVVKRIVQKGLKRSYYTLTHTLRSRIKGKILVAQTIKGAVLKSRPLDTICSYNEFGFNGIENRILKKTLRFASRFIANSGPMSRNLDAFTVLQDYINPAFEEVSEEASLTELRDIKVSPFFKEYREALSLAKLILKRYAYNINSVSERTTTTVPPFWIDMSKLFELYVLAKLRKKYGKDVIYQHKAGREYPDFLLKEFDIVIDAKYKPKYEEGQKREDIRQLSGYARNEEVLKVLGVNPDPETCPVLRCWIIYPAQLATEFELARTTIEVSNWEPMTGYVSFFKSPVSLPVQSPDYH